MTVWGIGIFENEDACDFVADVADSGSAESLQELVESICTYSDSQSGMISEAVGREAIALGGLLTGSDTSADIEHEASTIARSGLSDDQRLRLRHLVEETIYSDRSQLVTYWEGKGKLEAWQAVCGVILQKWQHR